MNHMQSFAPGAFSFGPIGSRSLSALRPAATPSTTPDGSKFFTDSDGDIVYVQYSSGAIVSRHERHVSVRTADGDYWMGNFEGQWFRLD